MSSEPNSKQKILAIALLVIGVLLVFFFGMRMVRAAKHFRGRPMPPPPADIETDVSLIRDWMTVPFISRMYHVPGKLLFDALKIPPQGNDEKSLSDLNREYYPDKNGFVIAKVREAVQANQPPLPPDAGAAPTSPAPIQP